MAVSFFCFFGVGSCRPTIIAANLPAICRGGIHPSRVPSAAANSHGGQRAGRPTYDPGRAADLRGAIAANLPAICRGRIHAARNLPPNPFYGQSVGEGFIPPRHFPPPQTSTAARGLAALHRTREGLLTRGASRTPPPTIVAANSPAFVGAGHARPAA